jgi:hypothetical protein
MRTVRCFCERKDHDQWVAHSLEFGLTVHATTEGKAKQKLKEEIKTYLQNIANDRAKALDLLKRCGAGATRFRSVNH